MSAEGISYNVKALITSSVIAAFNLKKKINKNKVACFKDILKEIPFLSKTKERGLPHVANIKQQTNMELRWEVLPNMAYPQFHC